MKKKVLLYIITIIVFNHSFAQWTKTQFDNRSSAISVYSDLIFKNSEDLFIYNKDIDRSTYFLMSNDGGNTWQRKNIIPLVINEGKSDFCWGFNSVETNPNGDLFLTLKYRPCYDLAKMDYLAFRSSDNGNTWTKPQNVISPSLLNWDPAGNSTIAKGESLWYTQSLSNNAVVAVSVASYIQYRAQVYIYKTLDNGITWNKTPVSVNAAALTANIIPGFRFTDANKGMLFLNDKYLATTDGGNTWVEYKYPLNDALVVSADITGQDIYASTGKDVYVFNAGASTATAIYHTDDDNVYKVKLGNGNINLLTQQGYYLKRSLQTIPGNSVLSNNGISLFPNPSVSGITVYSLNNIRGNVVKIYDPTGKLIEQRVSNENSVTFNTQYLSAGIYYAEVQTVSGQKITVLKWVKQ